MAGGPQTGVRGEVLTFDGSGSSDGDGDPLTYAWDFGDGSAGSGPSATHAYATLGTFTVTLVVSDGVDSSAPASTTVTIANRRAGGQRRRPVLRDARRRARASTGRPPPTRTATRSPSRGRSATAAPGADRLPSHTYATDGSYTVTVVVSDDVDPRRLRRNARRVPSAASAAGITMKTIVLTVTRPTTIAAQHTSTATRAPTETKHAAARACVNDGYASSSPAVTQVTVPDRPSGRQRRRSVQRRPRYRPSRSTARPRSDPDGNPLTYQWSFGDGTTGTGASPTHVYTTVGSFVARLVVSDGGPQPSAESTAAVTIANRPPVANPGGPYTGKRTLAVQLNGSASTDPDGDPLTYAWIFGDGATGTGVSPAHLYTTLGTFTVSLTVTKIMPAARRVRSMSGRNRWTAMPERILAGTGTLPTELANAGA